MRADEITSSQQRGFHAVTKRAPMAKSQPSRDSPRSFFPRNLLIAVDFFLVLLKNYDEAAISHTISTYAFRMTRIQVLQTSHSETDRVIVIGSHYSFP